MKARLIEVRQLFSKLAEIVENLRIRDAGDSLVLLCVETLDVEEDSIGEARSLAQRVPVAKPRSFDRSVDAARSSGAQQCESERSLCERLATAQCQAAS